MKAQQSKLKDLITLLSDGNYRDSLSLSQSLSITPVMLTSMLTTLQANGIQVEHFDQEGYRLSEPLILLDNNTIQKKLTHQHVEIEVLESVTSTNDYLKNTITPHKNLETRICLAEQQTNGKGRVSRQWYSPFAQNIYFSCLYLSDRSLHQLTGLSLVVSLAVAKTLQAFTPTPALVKWPNDVMINNKKISGNLVEAHTLKNASAVIIGIGINVNMQESEANVITQPWTSLKKLTGTSIDRNQLCALLINNLFNYLETFEQQGLVSFINEWNQADKLFNQNISLQQDNATIQGKAQGINQAGQLLIQMADGSIRAFSSGDTAILK